MSRDNGKKYPRTIESKNSYLRIRAPEHLDVALEGLIRKVLKEQPKMDDIYAFAADYFDMLLKIREKAGIRKLSVHDICPYHNEEDANDMIKLASTFTKRNKETKSTPRTYRAVSLKHGDHRRERKGMKTKDGDVKNGERFNAVLPIVSEHPELEESKPVETTVKNEKPESDSEESDLDIVQPKSQDPSEKIVEAKEVILEEDIEEDGTAVESGITEGDINEITYKIIAVENEIQALENRKSEIFRDGNLVGENVDESKLETEDAKTAEAVAVKKELPQDSGDLQPTVGNEIIIREVGEDDMKQKEEEKASEESAKETGTEMDGKAESDVVVQETDDGVKSIPQETEAQKLDINKHDMQATKNYDVDAEETQESKVYIEREDMHEPSGQVEETEKRPSEEVPVEETQEEKPLEEVSAQEAEEKLSEEASAQEAEEEKQPGEVSVEEIQQEKPPEEVSAQEAEQEKQPKEVSVEEIQQEKLPEEVSAQEAQEEKPSEEVSAQEAQEEKPSEEVSAQEAQEEKPSEEASAQESEEEKQPEEVSVEEIQEDKPPEEASVEETKEKKRETDVQPAAETDPKEELVEDSLNTLPSAELKEGESEMKLVAESALEEVKVNETAEEGGIEKTGNREENTNNDVIEDVYSNKESAVMRIEPIDAAEAKEAELIEGEGQKNQTSGSEEFIDLEKQSEGLQNAELSDEQTGVASTADTITHDIESETGDDTVVITVPENAEKKAPEENYAESNNESLVVETGETGLKSDGSGAIAIASGIGAAAAVLDYAKKELVDQKSEEITEVEKKAEEADQQSLVEQVIMEADPQKEEMTLAKEVETFLNRERQHSSYDKDKEELNGEELLENEITEVSNVEVMSENMHGSLARMALPEKETEDEQTPEKAKSGPSDVEAEGDDHDRDGSTTSDEIEFEISPLRNTEIPVNSIKSAGETDVRVENPAVNSPTNEENYSNNVEKTDDKPDPIIIQVNGSESEDQTMGDNGDAATEQMKIFLEVPEPIVEEYPSRKVEEAMQQKGTQPEDQSRLSGSIEPPRNDPVNVEEEAIIDCANVGNEIIQTGEVQKVELIEGDEDILQVHLTTTIETVQENGDSLLVQMTSKVDPIFEVSMETRVNSPVLDEKMRLVKAAVIIQNGFRRFRKRKVTGEPLDASTEELDTSTVSETKMDISAETVLKDVSLRESGSSFSSSATKSSKGHNLSRSATRTLLETHSLDPIRKITPLKTRSLSTVRYGVADFDVWNQLVKELEEAATKIQSKYRGYKTRKKLQRGNAIQSTTTTSEDSYAGADSMEIGHRHTGEFHDSIVLPLPPK